MADPLFEESRLHVVRGHACPAPAGPICTLCAIGSLEHGLLNVPGGIETAQAHAVVFRVPLCCSCCLLRFHEDDAHNFAAVWVQEQHAALIPWQATQQLCLALVRLALHLANSTGLRHEGAEHGIHDAASLIPSPF